MTRLYIARGASTFGSSAATVAIFYTLYRSTSSPAWVSAYLALVGAATLISGPAAGWMSDRLGYRKVMILSDLVGGSLFLLLAFVREPSLMVLIGVLAALAELPFFPASTAFVAETYRDDAPGMRSAFGYLEIARNTGNLAGPVFAAVLLDSLGQELCFATNAVTFLVSAVLIRQLHERGPATGPREHSSVLNGIRLGWRQPTIRLVALSWIPFAGSGAIAVVADVSLSEVLGIGALGFGWLLGMRALGSIVVGTVTRRLTFMQSPVGAIVLGQTGVVISLAGIALSWNPLVTLALAFLHGGFDTISFVGRQLAIQHDSPSHARATILGTFDSVVQASSTVFFAIAGSVVIGAGPHGAYAVAAVLAAFAALLMVAARWRTRSSRTSDA